MSSGAPRRRKVRGRRSRRRTDRLVRLRLESLESRRLLAVTVDTPDDVVDGATTSINDLLLAPGADGKISLREAIVATNNTAGADEIDFHASLAGDLITLGGTALSISDDLTISGLGVALTTIDGDEASSVFEIDDGTEDQIVVAMNNLTVRGGSATQGGGIRNLENLTLTDGAVTDNTAVTYGGGIHNDGTLTIASSTVSGNTVQDFGGGIANTQGTVTIASSTLSGNSARTGGAIENFYGDVSIADSTISGNSAEFGAGAFTDGDLSISNSTISGNTATSSGGGVEVYYGSVSITNSTISGNSAELGGGVFNNDVLSVTNSTLTENSASVSGGGVYNDATATLTNSIVANSTAGADVDDQGVLTLAGVNLVEDGSVVGAGVLNSDPQHGPLADHGGPTRTHALLVGSPALDAGVDAAALDPDGFPLTTDQRGAGFPRIVGAAVDLGAWEAGVTLVDGVTVLQAESFTNRTDGASHRWWAVDAESPGVGTFSDATGLGAGFLQALTLAEADDSSANLSPDDPSVEFPIHVSEAGAVTLDVRAAGLSGASDSLWLSVPGAVLADAQGLTVSGGAVRVVTNSTGVFQWLDAGVWNLAAGDHTVRVSMRESGTALDALQLELAPSPNLVDGVTLIQAEEFTDRVSSATHVWSVVDAETAGAGVFTFATGPDGDFMQSLTNGGSDSSGVNTSPADPALRYEIETLGAGVFVLRLNAAGLSGTSDSVWATIEGATLVDAQGLTVSGDSVRAVTNRTGKFQRVDAGVWSVPAGVHTIRLSMRESGTAVDALVLEPRPAATPLAGTTVIQAEQFGERTDGSNHLWWVVDDETPGVGAFTGATGADGDYLQVLNLAAADDTHGSVSGTADPSVAFPIDVAEERVYRVRVRAAGLSSSSDSLWLSVPGATLFDSQGLAIAGGAVRVVTNKTADFEWLDAGLWTIPVGSRELSVSLRETGTALDALEVSPAFGPTAIVGATTLQAESYSAQTPGSNHRWHVVDAETAGVGVFAGATGPAADYLQALTQAGAVGGANLAPANPVVRFEISVAAGGDYDLDVRAAGLSGTTDSLWVRIVGATLADAQGRSIVDDSLLIGLGSTGSFAAKEAGVWTLASGMYTIEIAMRETGAALDAVIVTPL